MSGTVLGGWTDERVPDLDDVLRPRGVDPAEFTAWLAPQLASYRLHLELAEQLPTRTVEAEIVRSAVKDLEAAAAALGSLPVRSAAVAATLAHRAEVHWNELTRRLSEDLMVAAVVLDETLRDMETGPPAKRGRKSKRDRDRLLAAVVGFLRSVDLSARDADDVAQMILSRCGVQVPEDPADLGKLRRKVNRPK